MVISFHIAEAVIDFTVIKKEIILIIIGPVVVAMNTCDIASDVMQTANDIKHIATNSNAAQPNYGHRNRVITFSHLIFVF